MKLRHPRSVAIDWLANFTMNWLDRSSVKGSLQSQGDAAASFDFANPGLPSVTGSRQQVASGIWVESQGSTAPS
jgi:hypothetical protein